MTRSLLTTGLPTRIIKRILPRLDKPRSIHFPDPARGLPALLPSARDKLTDRIEVLTRNRDAMRERLAGVEHHRALVVCDQPGSACSNQPPSA